MKLEFDDTQNVERWMLSSGQQLLFQKAKCIRRDEKCPHSEWCGKRNQPRRTHGSLLDQMRLTHMLEMDLQRELGDFDLR